MKPWEGPGKAMEWLSKISAESLQEEINKGFNIHDIVEARAEADNAIIICSTLLHIASQFGSMKAVKILEAYGADIHMKDRFGLNPLSYSAVSYFPRCSLYFLINGVEVQDVSHLFTVFDRDNPIQRTTLFLIYGLDLPNFFGGGISCEKNIIKSFFKMLEQNKVSQQSVLNAYISYFSPDINQYYMNIEESRKSLQNEINGINNEMKYFNEERITELSNSFLSLSDSISKYISIINHTKEHFRDYIMFLETAIRKIEISRNKNVEELKQIVIEENDIEPYYHFIIASHLKGELFESSEIMKEIYDKIRESYCRIPNFDDFFRQEAVFISHSILSIKELFTQQFDQIRSCISKSYQLCLVSNSLASLSSMKNDSYYPLPIFTMYSNSFYSLKMSCLKSGILITNKEPIEKDELINKLLHYSSVLQKNRTLKQEIDHIQKNNVLCIYCQQYLSSNVCPHCFKRLGCILCTKNNIFCPGCGVFIEKTIQIEKTLYFGSEFSIIQNQTIK